MGSVQGLQNVSLGRKKQNEKLKKMTDAEMVKHLRQQNKMLQNELEIVKKYKPSFPQELISPKEVYLIIADTLENGGKINLSRIFKNLPGSTSGYYRYLKSRYMINSKKARLIADIQYIQGSTFKFGYRRVFMILEKYYASNGIEMLINIKQVQKIMKENNLNAKVRRKKPYKNIWNATKEDIVSENKLKRNFKDGSPREILLTDITYLHCSFGTAYLSAIKDSVTNEIVSYVVKDNLGISLSIDAINTLDISNLSEKVYIHSDQGVHYTSKKFRDLLLEKGIGQSMSRRGNCLDNAPMESFFGHFKDEVDYRYSTSLMELQEVIDNYMIYYNYERQQWGLNKMTPNEYRCHLETI